MTGGGGKFSFSHAEGTKGVLLTQVLEVSAMLKGGGCKKIAPFNRGGRAKFNPV